MRPALLALVASGLAAAACTTESSPTCPGDVVAAFQLHGALVLSGDGRIADIVDPPVPTTPDCTPDAKAPIQYPDAVDFDAKLSEGPEPSAAALCRPNGIVYAGARTDPSRVSVSASANPAILCSGACVADFRVEIVAELTTDAGGAPATLDGILVEVLTASRGACDACLPLLPGSDPPVRSCAGRYALTGTAVR